MPETLLGLEGVRFLLERRTPALTLLAQLATGLGHIEGYVGVIALLYLTWDKALAFRLAVLVLLTMGLNHLLKVILANPRPFVVEGRWREAWAVSPEAARELVAEYSTPSGHAMAAAAFYTHLGACLRSGPLRTAAVVSILATGLSRPYLGVHYVEDVLLGWGIGLALALAALPLAAPVGRAWSRLSLPARCAAVVLGSLGLGLATRALAPTGSASLPPLVLSYAGLLAGLVVAYPLETRRVRLDPRSGGVAHKATRTALVVAAVLATLGGLEALSDLATGEQTSLGSVLRFLRYAVAGLVGGLLGPWLCVRLGLAGVLPGPPGGAPGEDDRPRRSTWVA